MSIELVWRKLKVVSEILNYSWSETRFNDIDGTCIFKYRQTIFTHLKIVFHRKITISKTKYPINSFNLVRPRFQRFLVPKPIQVVVGIIALQTFELSDIGLTNDCISILP